MDFFEPLFSIDAKTGQKAEFPPLGNANVLCAAFLLS